ncbi:hypothetical protein PR048_023016 [Dryococelus australis]|uniref:Uncharacterized protein n=1 Tax=Dryococelus australis TaxID=614101 RepID=A0ABQ9GSX0_9NEOP|nr:hypothetical protein PR048_023016 [Dryococelus australis]
MAGKKREDEQLLRTAFATFAKFGNSRSDGSAISLKQSDMWMRDSGVIGDTAITTTDTGIIFQKYREYRTRAVTWSAYLVHVIWETIIDLLDPVSSLLPQPSGNPGIAMKPVTRTSNSCQFNMKSTKKNNKMFKCARVFENIKKNRICLIKGLVAVYSTNSSCTRQQNGVTDQQNVGTPFIDQRLLTSQGSMEPSAAFCNQSDKRPSPESHAANQRICKPTSKELTNECSYDPCKAFHVVIRPLGCYFGPGVVVHCIGLLGLLALITGLKRTLTFDEYMQFVADLAASKDLDLQVLKDKLTACEKPSTSGTTVRHQPGHRHRITDYRSETKRQSL